MVEKFDFGNFYGERLPDGEVLEFYQCGDVCMLKGEY